MADPTVFGLPWLYNLVKTRFEQEGPPNTNFSFGWKESYRKTQKSPRIVFEPGQLKDDYVRGPGGAPRRIATSLESCNVYLWALPQGTPATETTPAGKAPLEDELEQYTATRELYDLFRRAIHLDAHGVVHVDSAEWINPGRERNHGAELKVKITIESAVLDQPWDGDMGETDVEDLEADTTVSATPDAGDDVQIIFPVGDEDA